MNIIGSVEVFFSWRKATNYAMKTKVPKLTLGALHALLFLKLRKNFDHHYIISFLLFVSYQDLNQYAAVP